MVVLRKFLILQSLSILSTLCSCPMGNASLFWTSRILKRFIWKQSIRFEDIRTVFDLFQSGYFFFTIDPVMSITSKFS